ncbi:hypothetical protein D3C71_1612870 [compost metagenome]
MANSWYSYLGAGKDPLVPASYRRMTLKPQCICGSAICAIYLQGQTATTPSLPFSANILNYISDALANGSPQPVAPGGGLKLFVYMKAGCCG